MSVHTGWNRIGNPVRRVGQLGLAVSVIAVAGCGESDPAGIRMSEVAGNYQATTFEVEDAAGESITDQLALGATITLSLSVDGTTSGRVFIPAPTPEAEDFEADLAGTWTLTGPLVNLEHATNTFLIDIGFLFTNNQLIGERSTVIETIRMVFSR